MPKDSHAESAWPAGGLARDEFVARVAREGAAHRRKLPWRYVDDPYAVLVSEIMLQQTQVKRVERFWSRWLAAFPTIDALASASVSDVLEMWQGLGYNRRALALKKAADTCSAEHAGRLPASYGDLIALPGVGPATAAGVMAFAYEQPAVYLETNVRAVFIHELFPLDDKVTDRALAPLVAQTCPPAPAVGECAPPVGADPLRGPREWYYALLDYGAHLKATVANPTRKSAHYARQSAFEGSRRQKRAWIVRRVLSADAAGIECDQLAEELNRVECDAGRDGVDPKLFESIVSDLVQEGFFTREAGRVLPA